MAQKPMKKRKPEVCPHCGAARNNEKSILAYVLLAWVFGVFGVHRFYAGQTRTAWVMLILTMTIIGAPITAVWALVDVIVGLVNYKTPENIFVKQ
ncbi:MAG: TM2 domain-containing protein [Rickettsiales bacterium]|jgi:TM2 domain-containing membrane protein YozV|nr:TM2 domain-containing protein [Rickettsiales bacterium]